MFTIEGPGTVKVKARDNVAVEAVYQEIQVGRDKDEIRIIRIMLDFENATEAYDTATKYADAWNLPNRVGFDRFKDSKGEYLTGPNGRLYVASTLVGPNQTRTIEIRRAGISDKGDTFVVMLVLGFPAPKAAPDATTQPTK